MDCRSEGTAQQLTGADRLWLFMDYDGTLAEFASTPDTIIPDTQLVELLTALAQHPKYRLAVVSGRRLAHIRTLLPIPGVWLAGTYGIEILSPAGELIHRLDYDSIRSRLDSFKPEWVDLLSGSPDFYLEDKGWSLAIHAKKASDRQARQLLSDARHMAGRMVGVNPIFHILGGHKFLEICPELANKGSAVQYLLERDPFEGSLPVYVGDDDKDEEAFVEINRNGGIALLVASESRPTHAACRLDSPSQVRTWLSHLISAPAET
jgi:trehalose 6-phosphate phosphatase